MKSDGGPEFPAQHSIDGNWVKDPLPKYTGMSLRDYFAGQALAGLLSDISNAKTGTLNSDIAVAAYGMADAMIAEREKKHG